MRDLLPDEAEELLGRRFAIVQAWRAIGHRIESDPITVADARTVEESDFVPVPRTAPGRVGETWRALYNPEHRFFYYPHLSPDEAIFFKVYDSATDGRARYTLHTAFELPDADPNAAPRHSVEMRLFALTRHAISTRTRRGAYGFEESAPCNGEVPLRGAESSGRRGEAIEPSGALSRPVPTPRRESGRPRALAGASGSPLRAIGRPHDVRLGTA